MRQYRYPAKVGPRFSALPVFVLGVLAAAALGALYVGYRMLFASAPQVSLGAPFQVVGRNASLVVEARDSRHGLRALKVAVEQNGKEHVLLDEAYDPPRPEKQFQWLPAQDKAFRLAEGPGTVKVTARNASWGSFFRGRRATLEQEFRARLTPPRIEVLTTQHYVNQGGCDMVVYKVTPPEAESGVVVGTTFFKGFPLPGAKGPGLRFAVFGYPYDAAPGTAARLLARDEAQNETLTSFHLKLFPKRFRSRELPVDDAFLNKVVPEILSQTPSLQDQGDLVKNYLAINRGLRQANNARLAEMADRSEARFLWKEPFQQLGNSQVEASFADHRAYTYQGREIDRQDHLGYDLATTSHAPVSASNDGTVVMAEFFGIYGNTLVVDHGYGLMSLYGHLSSFGVRPGDVVRRGQELGRSGATGLAGGDHLHFSMLLQSAQVDPKEWWDPHWIEDRILSKLRQFGASPSNDNN